MAAIFLRHMRLLKTIGLFGLLTLVSCDKPKADNVDTNSSTTDNSKKVVIEDSFAYKPLNVDNLAVDFADFEVKKEPFQNRHNDSQVDTIVTLIKQRDTLYLYKLPTRQFLYAMSINSNRIRLERNIRLGMSKNEFYKAFQQLDTVKSRQDFVRIWLTESSIDFLFKADTLSKTKWDSGGFD